MFRALAIVATAAGGLALSHSDGTASGRLADRPLTDAQERSLKPGDAFRECPQCPHMVVIPSGEFLMGSPDDEPRRDGDEGPRQKVKIAAPFAAGKFEVTYAEWDACLADGGCGGYRPSDMGWGRGSQPAAIISWEDAQAYVGWLSTKTGRPYRLLSEAEWEYAARAGTDTPFWWGSRIGGEDANFYGDLPYPGSPPSVFRQRTVSADSFPANAFGLHNVHGNVWEWVQDCYNRRYAEMPPEVRETGAPWQSPDCEFRVFRGGSFSDAAHVLRSANRGRYEPFIKNPNSGFRVARTLLPR